MKNIKIKIRIAVLILLVLTGSSCVTDLIGSDNFIHGIDSLVAEIAFETVQLISADSNMTLAVYYFTVAGRESNISDYLISGLTTEIANLAGDGITMVSRQGLDRVMSEHSFMVSDLVSEETQVDIGELLGADVILIGYINPLTDYDKINIQLIEVETGVVLGGFFFDYTLEEGFAKDSSSEVIMAQGTTVQTKGASTITTIYENFDGAVTHVNPSHYEEFWGERILNASAKTGTDEEGYGFLEFKAEFDHLDMLDGWEDSDLTFYLNYKNDWIPADQDGVAVSIYPEGYSTIFMILQQPQGEDLKTFIVNLTLNADAWTELLIPFASFKDISGLGDLDFNKPVSIGIGIPYGANYSNFFFRDELFLDYLLMVDNIGFYKLQEPDSGGLIAAYEDEVLRAPGIFQIGGTDLYVDYSESDEGELKQNTGVEWQYLEILLEEDGPSGRYRRLYGQLDINDEIIDYLEDEQDLYLVYRLNTGISWDNFNYLSLLARSETFENCYLEIITNGTEQYYSSDFNLNSSWSSIKIAFSDLYSENGSLAEFPLNTNEVWISFIFSVPHDEIKTALRWGSLEFEVDLDQIMLQE